MRYLGGKIFAVGLLATDVAAASVSAMKSSPPRTVVTTDMEQDDLNSLIRYLLYTNELDTQGIVYSASEWHWAGNGQNWTDYRWTGSQTIEDVVIKAYGDVYDNLKVQDHNYPTPEKLRSITKLGNIQHEGEFGHDTEGSNLIRDLLLDDDMRPLYLQAWGGTNTIARALVSIEGQYGSTMKWNETYKKVCRKGVIIASGFQDPTYAQYISLVWPDLEVRTGGGSATFSYNCDLGKGNQDGVSTGQGLYFSADWLHKNIAMGPYGSMYRLWLDGQLNIGDPLDLWGIPGRAGTLMCPPLAAYDFLAEGDSGCYFGLLNSGIQDPADPALGGWGGRLQQITKSPNLWEGIANETRNGQITQGWAVDRWITSIQTDFAARMLWTVTAKYAKANHPPSVNINGKKKVEGKAGKTVQLTSTISDPDGDNVTVSWWQYPEEGTYPGTVEISHHGNSATVKIPKDAKSGQTISIILEGVDNGKFSLSRYDRAIITVE